MANSNSINYFSPAKWVVSKIAGEGTHTTIGGAMADASSGDTIVVMPGIYTENNTATISLNITAFTGDGYNLGNVTVVGSFTLSSTVTLNLSNLKLQTNSSNILIVGSPLASVNLTNCFLNCTNGIAISLSSGFVNLNQCTGMGSIGSNQYFAGTGGSITLNSCNLSAGASAVSTLAGTGITINNSTHQGGLTISGTGSINATNSTFGVTSSSMTPLTQGGSATSFCYNCQFLCATPSAISVGATLTLASCVIRSTNTNAITGAGTLIYSGLTFTGTSSKINTTTQTGGLINGGLTQAPTAGFLGEELISTVTGVAMGASASQVNFTSLSLTPGIWLLTLNCSCSFSGAFTGLNAGIGTTSANIAACIYSATMGISSAAAGTTPLTIAAVKAVVTATTTYYAVGQAVFGAGAATGAARFNAIRIA